MKVIKYSLVSIFLVFFSLFIWGKIYSAIQSDPLKLPSISDTTRIKNDLTFLSLNYWKFGYSAVMITNTTFFRNSNYHRINDKMELLNVGNMGLVIDELYRTITKIK